MSSSSAPAARPAGHAISAGQRRRIYERDGFRCQNPHCPVHDPTAATLNVDHQDALAGRDETVHGALDDAELHTLCQRCNLTKGAMSWETFLASPRAAMRIEAVVARYEARETISALAGEFGYTHNAMYKLLSRNGASMRPGAAERRRNGGRRLEIPNLEALVERYKNQETIEALAREADISSATLRKRFGELGVQVRGRGSRGLGAGGRGAGRSARLGQAVRVVAALADTAPDAADGVTVHIPASLLAELRELADQPTSTR